MSLRDHSILKQNSFSQEFHSYTSVSSNDEVHQSSQSPKLTKSVSFGKVYIREHSLTLGDHPCCSSGAPISLDWDYKNDLDIIPIDVYERYRDGSRRDHDELVLNFHTRYKLLRFDCGVSMDDIRDVMKKCKHIQKQRQRTLIRVMREDQEKEDRKALRRLRKKNKNSKNQLYSKKGKQEMKKKTSSNRSYKLLNRSFFADIFLSLISKIIQKFRRLG